MKKIGTPQFIVWCRYLDCKNRTKKKIDLQKSASNPPDEKLIRFILENSSIIESQSERAFSRVSEAINVMCKQLCPGQWCTRPHCKNYSMRYAYHCVTTRPSVCRDYKKYIEKKEARESAQNQENQQP